MDDKRQCTAKSGQSGKRCKKAAILGATVCATHGGSAPQVKRAAALRLLALVDPAIATLAREMATADRSADKQRAANSILDRAGVTRKFDTAGDPEVARALLLERLRAVRDSYGLDPADLPLPNDEKEE